MKRSFELLDGKSAKFWEIELDGKSHTVRYGKLGSKGQSKTKTFADEAAANKDAEKLIASKTKKGYAEVEAETATAPSIDPALLDAELVKLDADPSAEGRVVFGDWLQSVGHPWGEIISMDHAGKAAERDALIAANSTILGELARRTEQAKFGWQQGFIDEATILSGGNSTVLRQCMQALFALPAARYLRRLALDGDPSVMQTHRDWDSSRENMTQPFGPSVIRELAEAPKTLTELAFGDPPPTAASAYVAPPDLSAVAKLLPNLDVLEVQCAGEEKFSSFAFAKLRRLEVRFANASSDDLKAIRDADLPALEQLSVWLGGQVHCILDDVYSPDDYDYDEDDESPLRYPETYPSSDLELMSVYSVDASVQANVLGQFCGSDWPDSLRHLGLQSAVLDEAALEAIFKSGLVARLKVLDLSGGALGDKQAKVIVKHAKRLAHLERLDLRRNQLGKGGIETVTKALPNADCSDQRKGDRAPEFLFRYVATME